MQAAVDDATMRRCPTAMSLLLAASLGCGSPAPADGEPKAMRDNLATDLGVVRQARIAFSHHSVGVNILAGIGRLDAGSTGTRLRLASLEEAAALEGPVLAHGGGGSNGAPKSKIDF